MLLVRAALLHPPKNREETLAKTPPTTDRPPILPRWCSFAAGAVCRECHSAGEGSRTTHNSSGWRNRTIAAAMLHRQLSEAHPQEQKQQSSQQPQQQLESPPRRCPRKRSSVHRRTGWWRRDRAVRSSKRVGIKIGPPWCDGCLRTHTRPSARPVPTVGPPCICAPCRGPTVRFLSSRGCYKSIHTRSSYVTHINMAALRSISCVGPIIGTTLRSFSASSMQRC